MNAYLTFILAILIGRLLLDIIVETLNLRHIKDTLPNEFHGYFDDEHYRKSQQYLRDTTRFGILSSTFDTAVPIIFMVAGGFNWIDSIARSVHLGDILTGLVFTAILLSGQLLISIPFSLYSTFIIEERYGFNKTSPRTFVLDIVKGVILTGLIGFSILAAVLWFFTTWPNVAWLYSWIAVSLFQIAMVFIAPTFIMPLFNKFTPLDKEELRDAIQTYAHLQRFAMKGVYEMDGSKRSGKSNAFFTGFGRSRRIVLFDTLIANHTIPELVAIVAHEMGHYKKKHITQGILRSVVSSGVTFYMLSFFIGNEGLFAAFRMEYVSIYASFVFFGFLYSPLALVIGVIENAISRRHEFDADAFAATTTNSSTPMITALKKLSADNLTNLTPHPFKVFIEYSHPPVLQRIHALEHIE
jgi:STE24 endopeptidase